MPKVTRQSRDSDPALTDFKVSAFSYTVGDPGHTGIIQIGESDKPCV